LIGYEYTTIWVIFRLGILRFEFYSGKIESDKNYIDFKSYTDRIRVRVVYVPFTLGRATMDLV